MFLIENEQMSLIGPKPVRVFKKGKEIEEVSNNEILTLLYNM
jgi:hypothetical protein